MDSYTKLFIGGEWCDGADGGRIAVEDPATGEVFAEVLSESEPTPGAAELIAETCRSVDASTDFTAR